MGIIAASRLRAAPVVIIRNTVFGGIGAEVNTKQELVNAIDNLSDPPSLQQSDISLFEIDNENNISCFIDKEFSGDDTELLSFKFFYDFDGKSADFSQRFTDIQTDFRKIISLSSGRLVSQCFRQTEVSHAILPNIIGSTSIGHFSQCKKLKRIYLPNWFSDFFGANSNFILGASENTGNNEGFTTIWYMNPLMETIDNGNPHPTLVNLASSINFSNEVRYVVNNIKPNAVSDLTVSNITSSTIQINFTTPTVNTNSIDFYYVYLDYSGISFEFKYSTSHEISAFFKEISASGDLLTGLPSGTEITMQIQTVDYYHNVSDYSNIVTFTTS
jgi:hypothetical protein